MEKLFFRVGLLFVLYLLQDCDAPEAHRDTPQQDTLSFFSPPLETDSISTFSSSLDVAVIMPNSSYSLSAGVRIKVDSLIWIRFKFFGFTVAKVLLTPSRVSFYEKKDGTYYQGGYEQFATYLGYPFDFYNLQRFLMGYPLHDFNQNDYRVEKDSLGYKLLRKAHFCKTCKIHEAHFHYGTKPTYQRLILPSVPDKKRFLEIFNRYQALDLQRTVIVRGEQGGDFRVELDYHNIDYHSQISTPFQIPPNYRRLIWKLNHR